MKTKTYTPYPIAPNEKEFDLISEQPKVHKSNKSGGSIAISDFSKNNINQSRSAVSAIQNETESEPVIQRRNTAQRLINDPKLQQIRMFMERFKPKKKEDGNNSNTMFKRSKSTMVTSDTVSSLKKISRNIHEDNDGLQIIKEKTEDNEDTSRSSTIKKRKMQLKNSKEIEIDNVENEESNSSKKVLKSRKPKEELKETIAPSLQDMITNEEEQIEEDNGKYVLSPSLQDMISAPNNEDQKEKIDDNEEVESEKPIEEKEINIEENEEIKNEMEDKKEESPKENNEDEKIHIEENEEEGLENIKEEKESTSHFITESDHLTKPNISNITPIQEVSNLDNNIIMTENSLINPPSKKTSKKTNVYTDIIEHTRVVLHKTGSRNFQPPTYHSNTIESYTQSKKEPLHDITFRDYSNKKPIQTSYRQYQYPSFDNKRLYYIYSDNELYNKIAEKQTHFETTQINRDYTKPIIRSHRNNLSVNTNRDNIDFSYSNTNNFLRPSKRDFTYCNTNYTPYKREIENLYLETFKKSHFESTQYESPSRISNPSLTERESEDTLCYKCRQALKQNRMLNIMTQ